QVSIRQHQVGQNRWSHGSAQPRRGGAEARFATYGRMYGWVVLMHGAGILHRAAMRIGGFGWTTAECDGRSRSDSLRGRPNVAALSQALGLNNGIANARSALDVCG